MYLYAKEPDEAKYNNWKYRLKLFKRFKSFSLNGMDAIEKILKIIIQIRNEKYWLYLVMWFLICLSIKKLNQIVNKLFIRRRKIHISLVVITQSYFAVPKNIRLN